ncbi:HLA class II histocompatibility antigen, DQ alpha 2 chain-like [Clinocottus analis]|uniref:HLA class II histocompatibility antigen, DQ alpha 2 chain-like n=1 Tax=Clinocottus analis TaxID=304258 RepID=UPI0035C05895
MTLAVILLLVFTGAVCTSAATTAHDFRYVYECYESGEVRVDILVDGDVLAYADFSRKEVVFWIPHLPESVKDLKKRAYEIAKSSIIHCRSVMSKAKKASAGAIMRQDAPDVSIYSRYEAADGVANTLFCLADNFYPPSINFTWTKNGAAVSCGVSDLRYSHNGEGTFRRISALSFTPREGDVYSCSVEHQASTRPLARSWELKESPGLSPAAGFFSVSLVLCLLGIMSGAFFFNKQPN